MANKTKTEIVKSTSTQVDVPRDSRGRYLKGYKPPTTFKDRPEDRYDITKPENCNPQHSPRVYLRKFWGMPAQKVRERIQVMKSDRKMTYGEFVALTQASRAQKSARDFEVAVNQAEGLPTQPVDMEIKEPEDNPLKGLTLEQLRRLAGDGNSKRNKK